METKEKYESRAKELTERIIESRTYAEKFRFMMFLAINRFAQYERTGDLRAKRLSQNCFKAAEKFYDLA